MDSFGCLGGLKINYKMEVVDQELDPIPGLYGVGSEVNCLYAGTYPGKLSGNTSRVCLQFRNPGCGARCGVSGRPVLRRIRIRQNLWAPIF